MNLVYFFAGAMTCFVAFLLPALTELRTRFGERRKKQEQMRRPWSGISDLKFKWDYDFKFEHDRTVGTIVMDLSRLMLEQMKLERSENLARVVVRPGKYSVRMNIDCTFVRRDE